MNSVCERRSAQIDGRIAGVGQFDEFHRLGLHIRVVADLIDDDAAGEQEALLQRFGAGTGLMSSLVTPGGSHAEGPLVTVERWRVF